MKRRLRKKRVDHPGWEIAQTLTKAISITAVFTVCMYVFANNFDANEIQTLASGGGVVAVVSAVSKFWQL